MHQIKIYYYIWNINKLNYFMSTGIPAIGSIVWIDEIDYQVVSINWKKDKDKIFKPMIELKG